MKSTEIITLIGISLSTIVGSAALLIGIKNSKKTIYINSVTASRIRYMQDIRNSIAEFCGLFYRYNLLARDCKDLSTEKLKILESADRLKYLIQLYLNPEDKIWDTKIVNLIDSIRNELDNNPDEKIEELILISQYLLKLEWEGAKLESQKGRISDKKKQELNKKYADVYKKAKCEWLNSKHESVARKR